MQKLVIILLVTFQFISFNIHAQEGPGGVGDASTIETWLDASRLGLSNNDPVVSWTDFSGNNNHGGQLSSTKQPTLLTNQINGLSAVDFDGIDDYLEFSSDITATASTIFTVVKTPSTAYQSILALDNHILTYYTNYVRYEHPTGILPRFKSKTFGISYMYTGSEAVSATPVSLFNDYATSTVNRTGFKTNTANSIGAKSVSGSFQSFFEGQMAEIIVFNENLNSAKRKIVANNLASKYDLTAETNLYAYKTSHGKDVIGLGQESDGSHTNSRGLDSLKISNPSALGNGDYLLVGNDDGGFSTSTSVGSDATKRWTKIWRTDVTGTPGTIDLTFYLGTNDFAGNSDNYAVMIENVDGDFSNGGTTMYETGRSYDAVNKTISFTGISLADGDYFTLVEKFVIPTVVIGTIDFGPGGVGSTTNLDAWLDASRLSLSNNDDVSSWTDYSGNDNHAVQVTSGNKPTYITNQLNGMPAVDFDAVDDYLEFTSDVTATASTIFAVVKTPSTSYQSILALSNHNLTYYTSYVRYEYPTGILPRFKSKNFGITYSYTGSEAVSSTPVSLFNDYATSTVNRVGFKTNTVSSVGAKSVSGTFQDFFEGQMSEIIIFNENINSAKRKIVGNYLAAKYDLTAESNLYSYEASSGNDLIGIGQESDGSHTNSRGLDSLEISNPSSLGNGDYLLIGNDGGSFSATANAGVHATQRWTKVWRTDVTGTPGTIDLVFYLGSNDFATDANQYAVLIENVDGDFSNGGTSFHETGRSYDAVNKTVTFTGLNLSDGDYFTLAELDPNPSVTAIATGNWESTSTWSCTCIPAAEMEVTVPSPFNVTINELATAKDLTVSSGASVIIGGNDTLIIAEDLTISGSFNSGTNGTIFANGTTSQTFNNSSGANIEVANLVIDNASGVSLINGTWIINLSVEVKLGTLNSTSGDVQLNSDASATAQILPSVNGAFVGNVTVERYIDERTANFGLLSSPIHNATVAELDDDLFLSGITGGRSGTALTGSGGTFYSMFAFNRTLGKKDTISSISTVLNNGEGYEVYLDSNGGTFTAATVDFIGIPNDGDITPAVIAQGFNLVGNPYQSFIEFDNLDKSNISNLFYLYDTQSGSYILKGSGDYIAPGQGFWVHKSTSGTAAFNFEESDKVSSNSSVFVRKKRNNDFLIEIKNVANNYSHEAMLGFSFDATNSIDKLDARYLPSPLKEAPAIYFSLNNDFDHLVRNTLNSMKDDFYSFKLSLEIGESGPHNLSFSNASQLSNDFTCIKLIDKQLKKIIDVDNQTTYAFEAEAGKIDRFEIILSNSWDDCEEDELLANKSISSSKAFDLENRNGEWYLNYNLEGKDQVNIAIYSLNGQLVKPLNSITIENKGSVKIDNFVGLKGIYMLQVKGSKDQTNRTINL